MNTFLLVCLLLALISLGILSWFHLRLRNRLTAYAQLVRRVSKNHQPARALPEDQPGLAELSNAVKFVALTLQSQNASLEMERTRLASILDQMTDGVLIADSNERVTFSNPAAARLFDNENAIGRSVTEVLRQHQLVDAWRHSHETRQSHSEAVEIPSQRLFLQMVVIPDLQTGGSLLLVQDLTRVRRLETVRRDFISNLSHELRTPLASLKALTETLRDGALDDPNVAPRFLGRIETEVDALTQMAQELLDLSRIESGQGTLEFARIRPSTLMLASAERMHTQAERAGLSIEVDSRADLPEILADVSRLEQVQVNLIHNAIKFTTPGGKIELSGDLDGNFVRFTVKDTGIGIPEEDLDRIFERFFKSDRARSGGGTGLGLSISRHIVEAHGGRIWAESVEGKGSSFHFTIPIA